MCRNKQQKILVIRNDKIGDFMLAWPSFALLKKQYPDAEITALVPEYTADLARLCEWIDHVLIDERKNSFISDIIHLKNNIENGGFDTSISLFSESRTSLALWLAKVKQRIGPATKIAQVFLNDRLRQKRSASLKPEYEYNLDLIKHFIKQNGDTLSATPKPPFLCFDKNEIRQLRTQLRDKHAITEEQKIVIIHPGTGGSAINLSSEQYAELVNKLRNKCNLYFIITAGPGERSHAKKLSNRIGDTTHYIHDSKSGIIEFCKLINTCDLFISGSTGPLHIAGALNMPTVAFYPAKKSATSLRWQTINEKKLRLAFMPNKHTDDKDLQSINIDECASIINNLLTRLYDAPN